MMKIFWLAISVTLLVISARQRLIIVEWSEAFELLEKHNARLMQAKNAMPHNCQLNFDASVMKSLGYGKERSAAK